MKLTRFIWIYHTVFPLLLPPLFAATAGFCFPASFLEGQREREAERVGERLGYNRILVNLFPLASQASPPRPSPARSVGFVTRENEIFHAIFRQRSRYRTVLYTVRWEGEILRICMLSTWFLALPSQSQLRIRIDLLFFFPTIGSELCPQPGTVVTPTYVCIIIL